eukprot:SAG22_NODE_1983_length_3206_cov_3.243000_2_plen_277_part_00
MDHSKRRPLPALVLLHAVLTLADEDVLCRPADQEKLVGLQEAVQRFYWIGALPLGTSAIPTGWCCPIGCIGECCEAGDQLDSLNPCGHNAGGCCGYAGNQDIDDLLFLRLMLEWLEENLCIDEDNVFGTGFSNGGMMANRAGCQASEIFTAVAPVAGNIRTGNGFDACTPTRPVTWLSFCGSLDSVCNTTFAETAATWSRVNGCIGAATQTFRSATTECRAWHDCNSGTFVEYCLIDGLGHEWPGRPRPDGNSPARPPARSHHCHCEALPTVLGWI